MKLMVLLLTAALGHAEVVRFARTAEPKEGAFTILIPEG